VVADAINDGTSGYNNLQWTGVTWYHRIDDRVRTVGVLYQWIAERECYRQKWARRQPTGPLGAAPLIAVGCTHSDAGTHKAAVARMTTAQQWAPVKLWNDVRWLWSCRRSRRLTFIGSKSGEPFADAIEDNA
jgi:hypothetical protein